MSGSSSLAKIRVGTREVPLPEGVTVTAWALERNHSQNPRIRTFLGCIRLLEEVMDSNFAILHCSPERLGKIRRHLVRVVALVRGKLDPLVRLHSELPDLEVALRTVESGLVGFERTVCREIDTLEGLSITADQARLREALCVLVGKVHSFLIDTFGRVIAADPRSQHDSDYFLSRRFPRDIEEAEWLYATVDRLQNFLDSLAYVRTRHLQRQAEALRRDIALPAGRTWADTRALLELLLYELTPKLKEILALRGIRYSEVEMLDRHTSEIPAWCRLVLELHDSGQEVAAELGEEAADGDAPEDGEPPDATLALKVLGRRMATLLENLDRSLQDLSVFVPLWLNNIALRRALLLRKSPAPDV